MEFKRLGDMFEFIRNGKSIKQDGHKGYPITRIETIADGSINLDRLGYASIMEIKGYEEYLLKSNDILMSHINSEKHLGKVAIFDLNEKIIHGMNLLCLRPKEEVLIGKYACYYFNSEDFKKQIPEITKKSVNQASFNITSLKNLVIPIIQLQTQKKIVEVLDKAQELIDARKKQIKLLDDLIYSVFYNMFGVKFETDCLENLCKFITKGTTPKANYIFENFQNEAIPFLKVYHITESGTVNFDYRPSYISKRIHDTILKRSYVFPNDVLMNIVGPPLGKICIVPNTFAEWNVNQAIAIFRTKETLNPRYLLYCLRSKEILNPIISMAIGIRQQNISLKQCREIEIPVPPIELQNRFAQIVQQIENQKQLMQQSLTEMENNFNNLMQRAFKGELFS